MRQLRQPRRPAPPRVRARRLLGGVLLAALVTAGGCEQGTGTDDEEPLVEVLDFEFEPQEVEVPVGTTVEWFYVPEGDSVHTVTFDAGPDSGDLLPGETYTFTFEEAGMFRYHCTYHPGMLASVQVTD